MKRLLFDASALWVGAVGAFYVARLFDHSAMSLGDVALFFGGATYGLVVGYVRRPDLTR